MIRLACEVPKKVTLACSGGRDSMSALEFLLNGKREVTLAYFNHGTRHGREAEDFVRSASENLDIPLIIEDLNEKAPRKKSSEAFWHEKRHEFFETFDTPVVLAHHLSDAAEWWIFSSFRGRPSLMPVRKPNSNIIRPFLLSPKKSLHRFSKFSHIEDPSNSHIVHARNYIRKNIMPHAKKVNAGIETTVRNLYDV